MSSLAGFWSKVIVRDGCWGWEASKNNSGYGEFWLAGRHLTAHRFSYELHKGTIPDGLCVLHSCDNRSCCNPDHLFLGTRADNTRDAQNKGRLVRGDNHPSRKLSSMLAAEIRALVGSGLSYSVVAGRFGVSKGTVGHIARGETWKC